MNPFIFSWLRKVGITSRTYLLFIFIFIFIPNIKYIKSLILEYTQGINEYTLLSKHINTIMSTRQIFMPYPSPFQKPWGLINYPISFFDCRKIRKFKNIIESKTFTVDTIENFSMALTR